MLGGVFLVLGLTSVAVAALVEMGGHRVSAPCWLTLVGFVVAGSIGVGQAIRKVGFQESFGILRCEDTEPRAWAISASWLCLMLGGFLLGMGWNDPSSWREHKPEVRPYPPDAGPQWAFVACLILLGVSGLFFQRRPKGRTGSGS